MVTTSQCYHLVMLSTLVCWICFFYNFPHIKTISTKQATVVFPKSNKKKMKIESNLKIVLLMWPRSRNENRDLVPYYRPGLVVMPLDINAPFSFRVGGFKLPGSNILFRLLYNKLCRPIS